MKKANVLHIIFCISLFLVYADCAWSECYNEDACFKDYVKDQDKDQVIAVNRETNVVELYWSDKDQTWIKPESAEQERLQQLYNKEARLHEMQKRLDKMRSDTWYNTSQEAGARR